MTAQTTTTVVKMYRMNAGIVDDNEVVVGGSEGQRTGTIRCGPMPMAKLNP